MERQPPFLRNGNITADPNFVYHVEPYGFYHLSSDSPCIDEGNNNGVVTGEVDIDGDDRLYNGTVDMGADEFTCGDVYSASDLDGDGVVNMEDFDIFSEAYLSHDPDEPGLADPNDADNWNHLCNLEDTGDSIYVIDIEDFVLFCDEDWLWTACWYEGNQEMWVMSSSGGGESLLMMEPTLAVESTQLVVPEQTLEEQIEEAKWLIEKMEEIWEDPLTQEQIDKKVWKDFMNSLYEWIEELEDMTEDK